MHSHEHLLVRKECYSCMWSARRWMLLIILMTVCAYSRNTIHGTKLVNFSERSKVILFT